MENCCLELGVSSFKLLRFRFKRDGLNVSCCHVVFPQVDVLHLYWLFINITNSLIRRQVQKTISGGCTIFVVAKHLAVKSLTAGSTSGRFCELQTAKATAGQ